MADGDLSLSTSRRRRRHSFPEFSVLPFDILQRITAHFPVPDVWAASLVCRSWRDALRPLQEAAALVCWGKRFKHGRGGVRPNRGKALESMKGAACGSTDPMVDAGLLYWEMGKREEAVRLYGKAAELGDASGHCNLGIFYLQVNPPKLEEAVKSFHLAACAGHVRAQYKLALCLQHGRGVEFNIRQAAKRYLKAAEGGNEWPCTTHHCAILWAGEVTRALIYLKLAARAGETAAVNVRDVASQMISSASRAWAISAANKWQHCLPNKYCRKG